MISLYGREFVMLIYAVCCIYVVVGQSQFIVVLAFKLFSFLNYIFIIVASVAIVPCTTCIEKYTVGLGLPPQNVLRCVFGLEGISGIFKNLTLETMLIHNNKHCKSDNYVTTSLYMKSLLQFSPPLPLLGI